MRGGAADIGVTEHRIALHPVAVEQGGAGDQQGARFAAIGGALEPHQGGGAVADVEQQDAEADESDEMAGAGGAFEPLLGLATVGRHAATEAIRQGEVEGGILVALVG